MIVAVPKINPPHVTVLPNDPVPSLPFNSTFFVPAFLRLILPNTSTVLVFTPLGVSFIRDAPAVLISSVPSTSRLLLICMAPAKEDVPSLLMVAFAVEPFTIRNELKTSRVWSQLIFFAVIASANEALPSLRMYIFSSEPSYIIKL